MESESKVLVYDEVKYLDIFSRNSQITDILELVFDQPRTEKDLENTLMSFWNMYDNVFQKKNSEEENQEEDDLEEESHEEDDLEEHNLPVDGQKASFLEFDVLCIYMLDCVFKRNVPTESAVSRSLYCYMKSLNLSEETKMDILNGTESNFVNALRDFKNFSSAEGEDILIDALMKCLLDGNFGLSMFLLKFALVEIPSEANEKSRKIFEKLVDKFNDILCYTYSNEQSEDVKPSIELDAILGLMKRSDINQRKSLMTFFVIILISEFRLSEKIEMDNFKEMMEDRFNTKFICLYKFFDEIPETKIKFRDIENFTVQFLCPLLGVDFGNSLVQFSTVNLCEHWNTLKPRSLQDITRSTIRQNHHNSMMFLEQVKKIHIPLKLKDFLLFHCEDMFDCLTGSHLSSYIDELIKLLLDKIVLIDVEN